MVLGLLTGNLAEGAALKLRSGGIDPARFRVGAYGSDAAHRPDLPADRRAPRRAVLRAESPAGPRSSSSATRRPTSTAAQAIAARAVAVATGSYSVSDLAACGPHAVFEDLSRHRARAGGDPAGDTLHHGARAQGRRPRSRTRSAAGSARPERCRGSVGRMTDLRYDRGGELAARDEVLRVRTFRHPDGRRRGRPRPGRDPPMRSPDGYKLREEIELPVSRDAADPGRLLAGAGLPAGACHRARGRGLPARRRHRAAGDATPAWTCCSRSRASRPRSSARSPPAGFPATSSPPSRWPSSSAASRSAPAQAAVLAGRSADAAAGTDDAADRRAPGDLGSPGARPFARPARRSAAPTAGRAARRPARRHPAQAGDRRLRAGGRRPLLRRRGRPGRRRWLAQPRGVARALGEGRRRIGGAGDGDGQRAASRRRRRSRATPVGGCARSLLTPGGHPRDRRAARRRRRRRSSPRSTSWSRRRTGRRPSGAGSARPRRRGAPRSPRRRGGWRRPGSRWSRRRRRSSAAGRWTSSGSAPGACPRWPLWLLTALVLGAAIYLGLVLGGYVPVPPIARRIRRVLVEPAVSVVGVGIDLVDLDRIARMLDGQGRARDGAALHRGGARLSRHAAGSDRQRRGPDRRQGSGVQGDAVAPRRAGDRLA